MIKPRWLIGIEKLALLYREMAAGRRELTPVDAAADALDAAAARADALVLELQQPTRMLTPAEWAAEQEPPVDESTARRWCRIGELDHEQTEKGFKIPAGARRVRRVVEESGLPAPAASPELQRAG